jgi:arsenate reductase (thioredoxin)
MKPINEKLNAYIQSLDYGSIAEERKPLLKQLQDYVQSQINQHQTAHLYFICTHNSRRSQFSHVWAQLAAYYFAIDALAYSGGVEVTAFNERAVNSMHRAGFEVEVKANDSNPHYHLFYHPSAAPIVAFSKLYDDQTNNAARFAAVMTCGDADENCPFIPGTEQRIPLRYEDPKRFDGTDLEAAKYDERSRQIATELFYVFSNIVKV